MTECRQQLWTQKIEKSTAAPKLCFLPPTTEAFEQNVYRAHFQVAQWYSTMSGDPPPLNAVDYGWEQMKQTSASSHEIWQKEYLMLLNRS